MQQNSHKNFIEKRHRIVTVSEWEEREQRAGQRSELIYEHWSMCRELAENV